MWVYLLSLLWLKTLPIFRAWFLEQNSGIYFQNIFGLFLECSNGCLGNKTKDYKNMIIRIPDISLHVVSLCVILNILRYLGNVDINWVQRGKNNSSEMWYMPLICEEFLCSNVKGQIYICDAPCKKGANGWIFQKLVFDGK